MKTIHTAIPMVAFLLLLGSATDARADIYRLYPFTGFPDEYGGADGVEDWGVEGWIEFNHEGPITGAGQFIDWQVSYYSPWAAYTLTPGNSWVNVDDRSGANFNVSGGKLTKPIGSNDSLTFIWDIDSHMLVHLGHTSGGDARDILLQDRDLDLNGNTVNVHVLRDPPNDLFATAIPEPGSGLAILLLPLAMLMRKKRIGRFLASTRS